MDRKFRLLRFQHAGGANGCSAVQWVEWECPKDVAVS